MPDASFPGAGAADDWDQDGEMAAYLADIEAGQAREPEFWESPGCTVSLGEAADVDPAELAVLAPGARGSAKGSRATA